MGPYVCRILTLKIKYTRFWFETENKYGIKKITLKNIIVQKSFVLPSSFILLSFIQVMIHLRNHYLTFSRFFSPIHNLSTCVLATWWKLKVLQVLFVFCARHIFFSYLCPCLCCIKKIWDLLVEEKGNTLI